MDNIKRYVPSFKAELAVSSPLAPHYLLLDNIISGLENETDRGLAMLGTSIIDEVLESLLRSYFKPSASTDAVLGTLKGSLALIGTFSARLHLAFMLEIIDKIQFDNCHIMRRIRNDFAHNASLDLNFVSNKAKGEILNFRVVKAEIKQLDIKDLLNNNKSLRTVFIFQFIETFLLLSGSDYSEAYQKKKLQLSDEQFKEMYAKLDELYGDESE